MLTRRDYYKLGGQRAAPKNTGAARLSERLARTGSGGRGLLPPIRGAFAPVPGMPAEVRLGGAECGLAERLSGRLPEPLGGWVARARGGVSVPRRGRTSVPEKGMAIDDSAAFWRYVRWRRGYREAWRNHAAEAAAGCEVAPFPVRLRTRR